MARFLSGGLPAWRVGLASLFAAPLGAAVLYGAAWPYVRPALAGRFATRAERELVGRRYAEAAADLAQARRYGAARPDWEELVSVGPADPMRLQPFWAQRGAADPDLSLAAGPFADPRAALVAAAELRARGNDRAARYAVEEALRMQPDYLEARRRLAELRT